MGRLADLHPILSFAPARAFSNSSFGLQNQLTIECDLPPYLIRVLVSVEALSPREHEVLQLTARGLQNKEQKDRCRTNHRRANGQVSRQFDFGQAWRGQSHRSRYDGASAGTNRTIVRYNILQLLLFGEKLCSPKRPLTREN